jgi:hypothetical protein
MQALHNAGEVMSAQDRATTSELAAEFERAMGSLAERPVAALTIEELTEDLRFLGPISESLAEKRHQDLAPTLTRIAAIALEGAARLRRGT